MLTRAHLLFPSHCILLGKQDNYLIAFCIVFNIAKEIINDKACGLSSRLQVHNSTFNLSILVNPKCFITGLCKEPNLLNLSSNSNIIKSTQIFVFGISNLLIRFYDAAVTSESFTVQRHSNGFLPFYILKLWDIVVTNCFSRRDLNRKKSWIPNSLFCPIINDVGIPMWSGANNYVTEMGVITKNHRTKAIFDPSDYEILL